MKAIKIRHIFTGFLMLLAIKINAEELKTYGNITLREMNEALVEELEERTGIKHAIPDTLKFSISKAKRASDKTKLIDNYNKLVFIKSELESRVTVRKSSPGYNDLIAITISDFIVTGPRNYPFPNAKSSALFTLARGEQMNNIIYSDFQGVRENTGYSITYRTVYSEDGSVWINGTKIENPHNAKISFHVIANNKDFTVNAIINTSKNGWN
ncbi:hypothetical protein [Marinomonas sp. IMCC 4694]|uniref:hypothetical protein n=1 Tax=Marinomonas sp. IMCC 4694 TaxID=2605432 RepID=UPI0011E80F5A|nr:hypothetical protein [Marinomonas sp. IMCC 4694]TYL46557.1 hypothetical protein FXV75_00550 [Marinomonas sp. IMCC 4694]